MFWIIEVELNGKWVSYSNDFYLSKDIAEFAYKSLRKDLHTPWRVIPYNDK